MPARHEFTVRASCVCVCVCMQSVSSGTELDHISNGTAAGRSSSTVCNTCVIVESLAYTPVCMLPCIQIRHGFIHLPSYPSPASYSCTAFDNIAIMMTVAATVSHLVWTKRCGSLAFFFYFAATCEVNYIPHGRPFLMNLAACSCSSLWRNFEVWRELYIRQGPYIGLQLCGVNWAAFEFLIESLLLQHMMPHGYR